MRSYLYLLVKIPDQKSNAVSSLDLIFLLESIFFLSGREMRCERNRRNFRGKEGEDDERGLRERTASLPSLSPADAAAAATLDAEERRVALCDESDRRAISRSSALDISSRPARGRSRGARLANKCRHMKRRGLLAEITRGGARPVGTTSRATWAISMRRSCTVRTDVT